MTLFWLFVSVLTLAGLAALLLPMLRSGAQTPVDERELRLAVYRDRRREIDSERAAGRLSAEEAERAIDDLAADLQGNLIDISDPAPAPSGRRPHRVLAILLTLGVPVAALVLYLSVGAPGLIGLDPELARGQATPADVAQAIEALQRRVREQPDDAQAWSLLARARRAQQDLPAASQAYAEATRLLPQDARLLAEFAETIAASRDGDFSGQPEQLLEQALKVSPDDAKALALMGAAQYRLGRRDKALEYLSKLLAGMDPASEQSQQIRAVADRIAGEIGAPPIPATASAPAATISPATPTSPQVPSAAARGEARIAGRIQVAESLRAQIPAGATLFVSARLPEGPRMPLAALRLPVTEWPVAYELNDQQSMTADRKLSQAPQVVIEARISRSGTAMRQSGDLIGASGVIAPGSANVDLLIDRVVP